MTAKDALQSSTRNIRRSSERREPTATSARYREVQHRKTGINMITEVRRRLHHAPCVARGADPPAFAGIGDEVVVSTIVTPRSGKAVCKDAHLLFLGCVVEISDRRGGGEGGFLVHGSDP